MHDRPARTSSRPTRRDFLKTAAVAAASVGVPYLVPSSILGKYAPSNRINVACIGAGNQTTVDLPAFLRNDDVQLVAICDVNRASHGYRDENQYLGREPQQKFINDFYAKKTGAVDYKGCDACTDFREVLARQDVDAVMIVVPDQWHALITVLAAQAGKDIYCEKPLSLTVRDGQRMIAAVRKYNRILQTGSQYRSSPDVRRACELVLNGRIGQLKTIKTYLALNNKVGPGPGWEPMPVPEGFDYNFWLGPAPEVPYHQDRCLYRFRFIFDYSGGQMTNFGAHSNDIAQIGTGMSLSGPVEYEPVYAEWPAKGSLFTTAEKCKFIARYANGVELVCESGGPGFGARFEGTEGWVEVGYKFKTGPESLKDSVIGPNEIHLPVSVPEEQSSKSGSHVLDHVRNFLNAVKSRQDPIEPVEIGHRTASLCHIANLALRLNRKLRWDPEKEIFPDDAEANAMLDRPMREPWTMPEI
jgi:predicted dehydrogenase